MSLHRLPHIRVLKPDELQRALYILYVAMQNNEWEVEISSIVARLDALKVVIFANCLFKEVTTKVTEERLEEGEEEEEILWFNQTL